MREDEREQRLQQRHQRQAIKRQRLEERRNLWSKRERGDFRVALMAYGPGTVSPVVAAPQPIAQQLTCVDHAQIRRTLGAHH
jgi:hypothetical protein